MQFIHCFVYFGICNNRSNRSVVIYLVSVLKGGHLARNRLKIRKKKLDNNEQDNTERNITISMLSSEEKVTVTESKDGICAVLMSISNSTAPTLTFKTDVHVVGSLIST